MDVGISEPSDYSEEKMLEIKDELDTVKASGAKFAKRKPNVIVVQLESFMDPSYVKELSFKLRWYPGTKSFVLKQLVVILLINIS